MNGRARRNIGKAVKKIWAAYTPEQKKARIDKMLAHRKKQ